MKNYIWILVLILFLDGNARIIAEAPKHASLQERLEEKLDGFFRYTKKKEVHENVKKAAGLAFVALGAYFFGTRYWVYDPIIARQTVVTPSADVELVQVTSESQFGLRGFWGGTCGQYAVHNDACLHAQTQADLNGHVNVNIMGHGPMQESVAASLEITGRDWVDPEELHGLIENLKNKNPNAYQEYGYSIVDRAHLDNPDSSFITNEVFLSPVERIRRLMERNEDFSHGIYVNTSQQLDDPAGGTVITQGHWFVVRIVKRAGLIRWYIADSLNNNCLDHPLVQKLKDLVLS